MKAKKCHAFFVDITTLTIFGTISINFSIKTDGAGWDITRQDTNDKMVTCSPPFLYDVLNVRTNLFSKGCF